MVTAFFEKWYPGYRATTITAKLASNPSAPILASTSKEIIMGR